MIDDQQDGYEDDNAEDYDQDNDPLFNHDHDHDLGFDYDWLFVNLTIFKMTLGWFTLCGYHLFGQCCLC